MLNTASAIMSFYERLEDQAAGFYDSLARDEKFSEGRDTFMALSKESRRHKEMVLRVYREVITDAIEAGFSFTGLDESDYEIDTELTGDLSLRDVLEKAVDIEEKSQRLCNDASESSRALMADITQALGWVASRKARRVQTLKSLRDEISAG